MESIRQSLKNYISTWLLALFALGLLTLLVFSEVFQNVVSKDSGFEHYTTPIQADILANIETIRLKNRLGKFTVSLDETNQWFLKEPRKMPAPAETIQKIIGSFKNISIHTLHEKEPINLKSFSLDTPVAILDLFTKLDEHIEVKIGLRNPIDNTSYMTFSNHDIIYQVNALTHNLQLLSLGDFIDSKIFGEKLSDIQRFDLYRYKNKDTTNTLSRTPSGWLSKRYRSISDSSVEQKLSDILDVRSHMIVDSKNDKLKTYIQNYLDNPQYRLQIQTLNGNTTTYTISALVNSMPDLKIEKKQYFLMKSSARAHPHLIHKDYLDRFTIRYQHLK